jgi:hypothetical protein
MINAEIAEAAEKKGNLDLFTVNGRLLTSGEGRADSWSVYDVGTTLVTLMATPTRYST